MNKKRKGFTLIELLAVIVILGLLMAIAIPSVTKYITQSRKKTVATTINNYMNALTNQVNDMEYTFTASNTVYAVPIECIALERGGTNPFGRWHQASSAYWAYVLVQYDDETSSYTYGFTFKDSAGYGLYPTTSEKLNESGKQIQTGLTLNRPRTGTISNITIKDNWTGFDVQDNTSLIVLQATSEGEAGNGQTTCTLSQKGDNYTQVEEEKSNGGNESNPDNTLSGLIKKHNTLITTAPTLTNSSNNTSDESGLYKSTATNTGNPTYYFRGNVTNNYVSFAGLEWKIIRINEDGTIRIILNGKVGTNNSYGFNSTYNTFDKMYYSNGSNVKRQVDNWYNSNIKNTKYDSYVSSGTFCEQAKVKYSTSYTSGNAPMTVYTDYTPDFRCATDDNGKGILNIKVGLITYDEVIYAGEYYNKSNSNCYLYNGSYGTWTMSPAAFNSTSACAWLIYDVGSVHSACFVSIYNVTYVSSLRPVINLNSNVTATGTGTSSDPYVIQTN